MSALSQEKAIVALKKLGSWFRNPSEVLEHGIENAKHYNAWFTPENVKKSVNALAMMLTDADIDYWSADISFAKTPKKIGVILAGNIPLVGFHDVLCILATGNIAAIKLSSADDKLMELVLYQLVYFEPAFSTHIQYVERLKDFEAVIATGSNNSSRYFDHYFGKVPHIIRKNRNSVAILTGKEDRKSLQNLSSDIFDYFGLGCRNVSKIYVPENYNFEHFFKGIEICAGVKDHFKYNNNYDYHKSIFLINGDKHLDNGFLLLKGDKNLSSPLAVLYYEEYKDLPTLEQKLTGDKALMQCIVSEKQINIETSPFGHSQKPKLWDYADHVNTIDFLNGLN
ncbi:MAG: acyl-CoA reductase [Pedobacter sp.]|nr:acyl-CoA reductase [Pedobacter sp.]